MSRSGGVPPWADVDGLFQRVLELPAARRAHYLADATRGRPALRSAVEELLSAADRAGSFLEEPLAGVARVDLGELFEAMRTGSGTADSGRIGERVGPYRLTGRLGRGGMATVYVGERVDGLWEQTVAVKIVRRGLDTDDVVRRFLDERQILSSLEHPHIARLLDGGTTEDGLPFLAMELVEGEPITTYCDERGLGVAVRLELFRRVARAVQYAHRNLVVHRDLKPSNVLVDRAGEPRLLDFGIARMLADDPDAGRTRTGRRLLTPDYASPEQRAGGRITTSTDVYQLGVLLNVLLTGRLPRARRDVGEAEGDVSAEDPIRPARQVTTEAAQACGVSERVLTRALSGDLGAIVLKALRPRPEDRYASVEAMVDDVGNYLEGRPVAARAGAWTYRVAKLVRRRPWLPPVAVGLVLAVGGYGATLVRHAAELEAERNAARAEAERAQEAQDFLVEVFRSADPYGESGPETTVASALDRGVVRIREELVDRPLLQAGLLGAVADVYTNLGLADDAVSLQSESFELLSASAGADAPESMERLRMLGRTLLDTRRLDSADVVLERGLALARGLGMEQRVLVAEILQQIGRVASARGDWEVAERRLDEARATAASVDPVPLAVQANTLLELAAVYPQLNDPPAALRAAEEGLELTRLAHGEDHAATAIAFAAWADALRWNGRDREAVDVSREAVARLTAAFGPLSPNVLTARENLAVRLEALGDLQGAEVALDRLLELKQERFGRESSAVATTLQNLAANLKRQGRLDEAVGRLEEAHAIFVRSLEPGHYLTAFPLLTLAEIELTRGDFAAGERASREASGILAATLPDGHYARAVADCRVGRSLAGLGRRDEGRRWLRRAAEVMARAPATPRAYHVECLQALLAVLDPSDEEATRTELSARLAVLQAADATRDPGGGPP